MDEQGKVILPKCDGVEITPGIWLIGEPVPRPDLGKTSMACLADVSGELAVVHLTLKWPKED